MEQIDILIPYVLGPENREFILTYDDIYFTSPVTLSDIRMLIAADCFQKNPGHLKQAKAGTHWISLMEKTMNVVQKSGGSTFNYETHLPRVFDKNLFGAMMERFSLASQPLMVSTLYYNLFHKDEIPLLLCDANPGIRLLLRTTLDSLSLKSRMRSHRFTNNSPETWSPVIKKVLSEQFPYKSSFEK